MTILHAFEGEHFEWAQTSWLALITHPQKTSP